MTHLSLSFWLSPSSSSRAVKCPPGDPCPTGPRGWFDNITARHLLSQSSGCVSGVGCTAPPGAAFTYDSDQYIQHLSQLIHRVTKMPAAGWATTQLAEKLGIPDFFKDDGVAGGGFSASGGHRPNPNPGPKPKPKLTCCFGFFSGQMASCREVARLAQIILNRGLWPTTEGTAERCS